MTTPLQPMTRRRVMAAAAAGSLGLATQGLPAQARILIGFPPEGSTDHVAR
jgi:hypothetical protein